MLDLELGLEAGSEPQPEAGYSTASRRGSVARTRDAMILLGSGIGDRDPRGIKKKPVSRDAYSLLHLLRSLPFD